MSIHLFLIRRALNALLVLLALSVLVFSILHLVPGDPAVTLAGMGASETDIAVLRGKLGLDQPIWVQYGRWLFGVVQGDWGRSIVSQEAVLPLLIERFRMTLLLATAGIALATVFGVFLGVNAALRANKPSDVMLSVIALAGVSAPIFWIGLILQLFFAIHLGILPATGSGSIAYLVLPAIAIAGNSVGIIMRMTRSSMIEVLNQDFVRTARAKGLSQRQVVYKHALRNAFIPVLTVSGVQFAYLMGGAVLIETVFLWPGIGKLLADSVFRRDFPVVQGAILMIGFFFVLVNTLVDFAYSLVDPRIRLN
ncbi:MAG: ABC transporter permease [Tropicimonas sp.]|uniref:ABC transporter permease n=1 Tax=Tropicimonas sp. TaxID=2067044 RepID=UPI003A8A0F1F